MDSASSANNNTKQYAADVQQFMWALFLYSKDKLITEAHLTQNSVMLVLMCVVQFAVHQLPGEFVCAPAELAGKWRLTRRINALEAAVRNAVAPEPVPPLATSTQLEAASAESRHP